MTSHFRIGCSDINEIWQIYAECHADYGNMVEIETGSRFPIWRTFVFRNRKLVYFSRGLSYPDEIWCADRHDLLKKVTHPIRNRKQNCATAAAILKIDMTSYLRRGWSYLDKISNLAA